MVLSRYSAAKASDRQQRGGARRPATARTRPLSCPEPRPKESQLTAYPARGRAGRSPPHPDAAVCEQQTIQQDMSKALPVLRTDEGLSCRQSSRGPGYAAPSAPSGIQPRHVCLPAPPHRRHPARPRVHEPARGVVLIRRVQAVPAPALHQTMIVPRVADSGICGMQEEIKGASEKRNHAVRAGSRTPPASGCRIPRR